MTRRFSVTNKINKNENLQVVIREPGRCWSTILWSMQDQSSTSRASLECGRSFGGDIRSGVKDNYLTKCDHLVLWKTSFRPPRYHDGQWLVTCVCPSALASHCSSSSCKTRLLFVTEITWVTRMKRCHVVTPLCDVYYPVKWHLLITDLCSFVFKLLSQTWTGGVYKLVEYIYPFSPGRNC